MRIDWLMRVLCLAVIIIGCLCLGAAYGWTDHECRARGGHTEIVYGGWVCEGARQ